VLKPGVLRDEERSYQLFKYDDASHHGVGTVSFVSTFAAGKKDVITSSIL